MKRTLFQKIAVNIFNIRGTRFWSNSKIKKMETEVPNFLNDVGKKFSAFDGIGFGIAHETLKIRS